MSAHKSWGEIKSQSKADPRRVAAHKRAMKIDLILWRIFGRGVGWFRFDSVLAGIADLAFVHWWGWMGLFPFFGLVAAYTAARAAFFGWYER